MRLSQRSLHWFWLRRQPARQQ
uniref:Uncharacterized protein n=1 Tax=Arundo donax TaxID=35708 RepID=A0A0A8XT68_ARUDO